jgi:hypothetical protein
MILLNYCLAQKVLLGTKRVVQDDFRARFRLLFLLL